MPLLQSMRVKSTSKNWIFFDASAISKTRSDEKHLEGGLGIWPVLEMNFLSLHSPLVY